MMFGDPEDAGTVEPEVADGGDAATVTDGAADGGDGEAKKKVTIPLEEYLSLQNKAKASESTRTRVESGARDNATDTRAPDTRTLGNKVAERQARIDRLKLVAAEAEAKGIKDSDAQVLLDVAETAQESEMRTLYRLEMADVPATHRDAVKEHLRKFGGMPWAAYKWLRSDQADVLEAENRTLKETIEKNKQPRAKIEGTKMPGAVTRTAMKTDADGKLVLTPDEYIEAQNDSKKWAEVKKARRENRLLVSSAKK